MRKILLSILLLYIGFGYSFSNPSDLLTENYSKEKGLPNDIVNYSLKDKDGFLWFGTWYGICRFDGVRFKTYNNAEYSNEILPPRKIQKIVEDKNGLFWIKTIDRKLFVFDKKKEKFRAIYDDVKNFSKNIQIIKIQTDSQGDVLLLTKDKTLLIASTDSYGNIKIKTLFNSKGHVNIHNFKLNSSVFSETKDYICWVGTDYKLISFKKGKALKNKPVNYISNKLSGKLTSAFSRGNELWLGNADGAIYCINSNNGAVSKIVFPGISGKITSLMVTSSELIYFSTAKDGVCSFNMRNKELKRINVTVNYSNISDIYIDQYDKLWIHDNEVSLTFYDPIENRSKIFPFSNIDKICPLSIEDAGERGLFVLAPTGEAFIFDRKTLEMKNINQLRKISNDKEDQLFYHILLDNDGVLWLCSTTSGVYRINYPRHEFRLLNVKDNQLKEARGNVGIRAIHQMHNGDIWVGTRDKKLYIFDSDGYVKHLFPVDTYGLGSIYHIMEDKDGNVWLSVKGGGLMKFVKDNNEKNGYKVTRFLNDVNDPSSISGNDVYFTYQDSKGHIWVGSLDGGLNLIYYKDGKVKFYNKNNGFDKYPSYGIYVEVRNIIEDVNGRIWVGTMDGLMSFKNNFKRPQSINFETYHNKKGYPFINGDVYTIYKDDDNQIWASVFGGGLGCMKSFDTKNNIPIFKTYSREDGLMNDVVISIIEDNNNRLWFATESGLSYYNKKNGVIRSFDKYDGLPLVDIEDNTAIVTLDNEIWLGTREGILSFSSNNIGSDNTNYRTYIVRCDVNNKDIKNYVDPAIITNSITYTDKIVLNHNQDMFNIEFAALNYSNINRITYKYILEGYEEKWHNNGRNRIASYTNVPPGKYKFKVVAVDGSNLDFKSEASVDIEILPPWWATNWAYAVYFILFMLLLYFAIRISIFMIKVKNDIYIEQKLSEMKIKFFTNISHELRTPLTLIRGPIQEIKEKEHLTDKGIKYIELMEKNIKQMLQLVNQILDFRKIQNGKMKLHVSSFEINDLLQSFYNEFRLLSEENEISYTCECGDNDYVVWADKEKIEIVIRNIISNAFKFTPAGGSIYVSTGESEDGKYHYIRIEDTGVGIPENKLNEIFNRFSQLDNNQGVSNFKGSGIGLALSKEIIALHHGDICAESPNQRGAVFIIKLLKGKEHYNPSEIDFYISEDTKELPAEEFTEEDDIDEDTSILNSSLPSVLIVEDNKDLCTMLKLQFEDRYNIYIANDGADGMKKIYLFHPDIVVTDQMMPNMDGLEMLQRIRKDFQISHIPVIILTAKNDEQARTHAITLGANAYITKPFSKDYLQARIEQLLKERKLFREKMWQTPKEDEINNKDEHSYGEFLVQKDIQFIEKIHQVIEENIDNSDFNIDTIANSIGLSRSAFFKKLKSLTGFSPVDLVKEIRLNKAVELMKNSDLTISEIAYSVGFKDSGYFSKCFRKKYELTPSDYLNEWRKS